jgi:hypothetical protein
MEGNDPGRPQDRLSKPPHPEQKQKHPHGQLQRVNGHLIKHRPEHGDQQSEHGERRECSGRGGSPTLHCADREDDCESFNDLHEGGDKGRCHGRRRNAKRLQLHEVPRSSCAALNRHLLIVTARTCPSQTKSRQSTTDKTIFIPTLSHSPSRARESVCRLKDENVV